MKQIIDIIMGKKELDELDKIQNDTEQFKRWKNILLIFIKQSKLNLSKGLTRQNIEAIAGDFEMYFSSNAILTQYINEGKLDISYVEKQVGLFYNNQLNKLGINIKNEVPSDIENIFNNTEIEVPEGIEKGKTFIKSNGHSTLTDENQKSRGYVGAILMATLTASIEISTIAYILFNGM